jgi:hypothetical protein
LFYISDAFGVQARRFSCECDFLLSGYKPAQGMLDFEIRGGDCRTYKNTFNEVAYITGVHNLQLKFNASALPDFSVNSGSTIEITDTGTTIEKDFVNLKLSFYLNKSLSAEKVLVGSIIPIYAPITEVETTLNFVSQGIIRYSGVLQILPTGMIYYTPTESGAFVHISGIVNVAYRYKNS